MTLTLDAHAMTVWQSCKRRYELESEWRVIRWRPKALWDVLLRRAIFALANGGDAAQLASEAIAQFLQSAANPGLDLPQGANPYVIAKTWCGMFDTLLRTLAKTSLPKVAEVAPVSLSPTLEWIPRAWAENGERLHRWLTVDAWDEEQLSRTLHSWPVIGDLSATRAPMMLHVVEIGRTTKGGRSTPWSRAWQHPSMKTLHYRFRKPTGGNLSAGWTPYYYNDTKDDPDEWAEQVLKEGEHERAVHHLLVDAGDESRCVEVMRQVALEALEIGELVDEDRLWHTIPMSRTACDGFVPCPFQYLCYAPQVISPETLGLYQRREQVSLSAKGGSC